MSDTRIINSLGEIAGWNNVTVRILGMDLVGITKIQYGTTYEDEYLYGAGDYPVGYGKGQAKPTATIDLYEEEVAKLRAALGRGKTLRDIDPFDMIIAYDRKGGIGTTIDKVLGCRFTGASKEVASGQKGIITSFPLMTFKIEEGI